MAVEMPLQLDVHIFPAECGEQSYEQLASGFSPTIFQRAGQWAVLIAGKTDDSGGVFFQLVERCRRLSVLGDAQLGSGKQATEILISGARGAEHRIVCRARVADDGDLGSHMSTNTGFLRAHVKTRRTVQAVAIN